MSDTPAAPAPPQLYDLKTGEPLAASPDQIPQLLESGQAGFLKGTTIPVIGPDGVRQVIAAEDAPSAFAQKFTIEPMADQTARFNDAQYGGLGSMARAGLEGAARGLTLGGSDLALRGLGVPAEDLKGRRDTNPITSAVGDIAGTVAPIIATFGAAGPVRGALGVGRAALAASPAAQVAKLGAGIAEGLAGGMEGASAAGAIAKNFIPKLAGSAVEGALYSAGGVVSEAALEQEPDLSAEHLMGTLGTGALIGLGAGALHGGLEAAAPGIMKVINAGKETADKGFVKALSALTGTDEKAIHGVLKNAAAVEAAPSRQQAVEHYQPILKDILDRASTAKMTVKEAEAEMRAAEKQMRLDMKLDRYDAGQDKTGAAAAWKQTQAKIAEETESELFSSAGTVAQSMEALHQNVVQGSQAAMGVLKASDKAADLGPIFKHISDAQVDLAERGSVSSNAIEKLRDWKQDLVRRFPDRQIPLDQLKQLIKGLDEVTSYGGNAADFDKPTNFMFKRLRYALDDSLKNLSPEYGAAMKGVAEDVRLLKEMRQYGDERSAMSRLSKLDDTKTAMQDLANLQKLEEKTGQKFMDPVRKYISMNEIAKASPEFKAYQDAQKYLEALRDPRLERELAEKLEQSPEAKRLAKARMAYDKAQDAKDALRGVTPENVESRLARAGTERSVTAVQAVEGLADYHGLPAKEMAVLMHAKEAFDKAAASGGGRLAVTFGGLGTGIGTAIGGPIGAAVGAGLGTVSGAIMDKHGPAIVKKMLDGYVALRNVEMASQNIKREMSNAVNGFFGRSAATGAVTPATTRYLHGQRLDSDKPDRSKADRHEKFAKRAKEVAAIVADPSAMADRIANNIGPLEAHAPKISASLSAKAVEAASYLASKVPKNPNAKYAINPALDKWRPSDVEMAKFERIAATVDNPMTALKDLKNGTLTLDQVDALKTVYPAFYKSVAGEIFGRMTEMKEELPYKKRLSLSLLLGQPLDATTDPGFFRAMQASHQAANGAGAASEGGAAQGSGGVLPRANALKDMNLAGRAQTDSQRLLNSQT